jgi:hypothetical protein
MNRSNMKLARSINLSLAAVLCGHFLAVAGAPIGRVF